MSRSAFTLLEVFVALGMLVMLTGSVFAFLFDLGRDRGRVLDASRDAMAAAAIVESIERDLLTAFAGAPGVGGDATHLHISSRSVSFGENGWGDGVAAEIRYRDHAIEYRRGRIGEEAEYEAICERVRACRFRYFYDGAWTASFESTDAGALPTAIEIAVWFGEAPASAQDNGLGADAREQLAPPEASEAVTELPPGEPDLLRVMDIPDAPRASSRGGG